MKLNLDKMFKNLDGKDFEGDHNHMAKFLANALALERSDIPVIKAYDFALKLQKSGELEVDNSDLQALKKFVENCNGAVPFSKAQLLNVLNECKEV
jgi:hypothetical protein